MALNNQRIAKLITNPLLASSEEAQEVHALVDDHPYSSVLKVLDAKLCHIHQGQDKGKRLTTAAIFIADRTVLKKYIENESAIFPPEEDKVSTTDIVEKPGELQPEPAEVQAIISETVEPEEKSPETKGSAAAEEILKQTKPLSHDEIDDLSGELLRNIEEYKKNRLALDAILNKKLSENKKVTSKTAGATTQKPKADTTVKSKKSPIEKKTSLKAKDPASKKSSAKAIKKGSVTKKGLKGADTAKSEVKAKSASKKVASAKKKEEKSDASSEKATPAKAQKSSDQKSEVKPKQARKLKKEQQVEIIDKFIESEPQIAKVKSGRIAGSKEDLSISSSKFNDSIISENLAGIMIRQGKIDKAIDIYKRLIWKFPQKKAYFATQIEELKKK